MPGHSFSAIGRPEDVQLVLDRTPGSSTSTGAAWSPCMRGCLAREQYRAYTEAATLLLDEVAALTGNQWGRPVPELARLLVTLVDGVATTWLVDGDTAATRAVLDAGIEAFVVAATEGTGLAAPP